MRKLIAGLILLMALPIVHAADEIQRPETAQPPASDTLPSAPNPQQPSQGKTPVDTQSEAYKICLRATQLFDQQEQAKGNRKVEMTSLSASCQEELKSADYWRCMEKEANANVDFNTAHGHCANQNTSK